MLRIVSLLIGFFFLSFASTFATVVGPNDGDFSASSSDSIIYGNTSDSNIRNGNFSIDDIPLLIQNVIESLLLIAGTVSAFALIYHAVRMQLASGISGDSSHVDQSKQGIKGALLGFVLSMSAWYLVGKFVDLMSSNF